MHDKPMQEEIDEHEVALYPWRALCSACVCSAAANDPHPRNKHRRLTRPTIAIDYSFLSSAGQEEEGTMSVLNMRDLITERVGMEMVPKKGNNEYAVESLTEFVKSSGHQEVTIKSDQGASISALVDMVKASCSVSITTEKSPVGESSSNGDIESQIRRSTALVRVLKIGLEARVKERIEAD